MNELDEKYQQQILFENDELTSKKSNFPSIEKQIIVENDDWQEEEGLSVTEQTDNIAEKSKPRWLWRIVGVFFTGVVNRALYMGELRKNTTSTGTITKKTWILWQK